MQEILEESATLYSLGLLDEAETATFKVRLATDRELSRLVKELSETQAVALVTEARRINRRPDERIRERILNRVAEITQERIPAAVIFALKEAHFPTPASHEAVVLSDWNAMVRWVNPMYTRLTGHRLGEVRGRRAGSMLRGVRSEARAMEALSKAVHNRLPALERIVNYRKDGSSYLVEIDLRPVTSGFIALERELAAA